MMWRWIYHTAWTFDFWVVSWCMPLAFQGCRYKDYVTSQVCVTLPEPQPWACCKEHNMKFNIFPTQTCRVTVFLCVCEEFILKKIKSFPDFSEEDKSFQTADWPGAAASCAFEVKSDYFIIFLSFYIQHWSTCWTMSTVLLESDFEICLFTCEKSEKNRARYKNKWHKFVLWNYGVNRCINEFRPCAMSRP